MTNEYIRLNYSENNCYDLRTIISEEEYYKIVEVLYNNNKNPKKVYITNNEIGLKIREIMIKNYNFNSNIFFFI